jgi:hypothetical protein
MTPPKILGVSMKLLILFFLPALALAEPMPLTDFEYVAAGQSNQKLGPVGGVGDVLNKLIIIPDTTAAGTVWLHDGGGNSQKVFVTGTLADLSPIVLDLGMRSVSGDWSITTGSNVHVLAIGRFK